jgi:ParB family chromosome partitioning protein
MAGLERPVVRNAEIDAASFGSQVSATERREPGAPSSSIVLQSAPKVQDTPAEGAALQVQSSASPGLEARSANGEPTSATAVAHKHEAVGDLQGAAEKSDLNGVEVMDLALSMIDSNPYQTRHFTEEDEMELLELGNSIKSQGLIQPITVRPGKNGRYVLIAGDRRTRAARMVKLETIPAIVWEVSEQQAAEMTIIENLLREDLNCMDQTRAFVLLSSKFGMTQAQIAERIGMSRESVSNYMRLARLPQEIQDFLINNELEFSHARLLLKIDDPEVQLRVARKVVKEHIPVYDLDDLMMASNPTLLKPPDEKRKGRGARWVDPNVRSAQRDLERVLGMRVRIRDRNNKGRIVIEYGTLEDFDRVVSVLRGK